MDNPKKPFWQDALVIFYRLSGWVLLPLIAGTLLGRWLDHKNNSGQFWFLVVIGMAFIISMIGLMIQAKKEIDKMPKS